MKEQTVEIPLYIRHVQLSQKRIIKYYEFGKKKPTAKKYADKTKFDYVLHKTKKRMFLTDLETGERVIANPLSHGTPKNMIINGQSIYNGAMNKFTRNKIMVAIKEQMMPYVDTLKPIEEFPLKIEMEIHDVIRENGSGALWDLDNRAWPYVKAFQDCLTGNKDKNGKKRCRQILPDDNILFITTPPVPTFIPVEKDEDRKLVFKFVKEKDKRIVNNKEFRKQLKHELDEISRIHNRGKQDLEKGRRTQRVSPLQARGRRRSG